MSQVAHFSNLLGDTNRVLVPMSLMEFLFSDTFTQVSSRVQCPFLKTLFSLFMGMDQPVLCQFNNIVFDPFHSIIQFKNQCMFDIYLVHHKIWKYTSNNYNVSSDEKECMKVFVLNPSFQFWWSYLI